MLKSLAIASLLLTFSSSVVSAQTIVKMAAFNSLMDFQKGETLDSIKVEIVPIHRAFTPDFCRPYPIGTNYYYSYLANNIALLYDGKDLLLNLKQFKILNGFVWLKDVKTFHCFQSRMAKPDENSGANAGLMFGLLGAAAHEATKEINARKPVSYVFNKNTGRIYVLNERTIVRFMEQFPDVQAAFVSDPMNSDQETMEVYLDILNELIDSNP